MKTNLLPAAFVIAFLLLPGTVVRAEDSPPETQPAPADLQLRFKVTLGGDIRDLTNRKSSKFELTREVPSGFFLRSLFFDAERPGRPYYFSLSGTEAGERDQRFRLVFERFGKARTDLRLEQFPRFSADNIQSLYTGGGNGLLLVPDVVQSQFQAALDTDLPGLVRSTFAAMPFGRLRTTRRRLTLEQEFFLAPHWRAHFGLLHERRTGDQQLAVGSYERTGTPLGSTFRVLGLGLPEPVNYRTTEFSGGVSYERDRAFVRADYRASLFRNRVDSLIFENPFRITDLEGNPPAGSTGRWRFTRGQLDLPPDNTVHTLSFSGAYFFPRDTRLSGAVSFSFWDQNDAFLPWTLNTAVATGVPVGISPTDPADLPQRSLNGKVTIHTQDWALTSRLTDTVRLAFNYSLYDYDNNSDDILFPGYVAFGDAFWRSDISGNPVENELFAFFRQRSAAQVIWKPRDTLSWKNSFAWEGWNREHRQFGRTNEWVWKSQLIWKPVKWLYTKAHYRYGDRLPRGAYSSGLEFSELRQFDQQHRIRHDGDFLFQINATDKVSFSGSYRYASDRYDERFYGLATYLLGFFVVDANFIPNDRFAAYANFTRERYRSTAKLIAKTGATDFAIPNTFERDVNDRVDSLGAGFDANFFDQRLTWNLTYAFAFSRLRTGTRNPFPIQTQATLDATAFPWPNSEEKFHEVRTTLSYRIRENVEAGVRYLFEPRSLQDFMWDIVFPYIFGFEAPESTALRWLLLDARDSSYHGHAAAVFLRYTF